MVQMLYIAVGGAIGSVFRYGFSGWVQNVTEGSFPWGTLSVNVTGSLLAGVFWGMSDLILISPTVRLFFLVGFLGGFTTFSSFSLETFHLIRAKELILALMNIGLNNLLSLVCVFAGYAFSRYILEMIKGIQR
jgi:fluoride exporter